eukprot:c44873_g1_i1 orf=102-251(-)
MVITVDDIPDSLYFLCIVERIKPSTGSLTGQFDLKVKTLQLTRGRESLS